MEKKAKKDLLAMVDCPHCGKPIEVWKESRVISPAVKAEKEEKYTVSKSIQTTLDDDAEE